MRIRWKTVARVVKTHARSGEVVAESVHGLPPLLRSGMEVALVPPALKTDRYLTVDSAIGSTSSQLVSFAGVRSIGEAQELVGKYVLAKIDDLPSDIALLDKESLVGTRVIDETLGELGIIDEVMSGPTQDVLVLSAGERTLLIPVIDEFVVGFDDRGALVLDLPEGAVLEGGE